MLAVEEMADDYPRIVEENQRLEDQIMQMNLMEERITYLEGELQQANFEKTRLKETLMKDHDFYQIRMIVDRIQQMILLKKEIGLNEHDYTLLKELFGQNQEALCDQKHRDKMNKLV